MKSFTHDARGFVQGVVTHLKKSKHSSEVAPKVTSLLMRMSNGARKERQATVESVVKLTADERMQVERILECVAGHKVSLDCRINPELIGGIRMTMADWVLDASIKSQLYDMAEMLQPE